MGFNGVNRGGASTGTESPAKGLVQGWIAYFNALYDGWTRRPRKRHVLRAGSLAHSAPRLSVAHRDQESCNTNCHGYLGLDLVRTTAPSY